MKEIELNSLKLKTFTEQNALDYCQINNLNSNNIKELSLWNNELTDISEIKIFKNLEELNLCFNKIKDISVLKDLNKLQDLNISYNKITDISVLKDLNKLETLDISNNEITDISIIMNFKNLKTLDISYLELESDQIKYIKSLKNLAYLWCKKGFKNISGLNQLNKNIKVIK